MKIEKNFFLAIFIFHINHVSLKLFPIEEKYPLIGKEPLPGSLWPMAQKVEGTSKVLLFFKRTDFKFTTNLIQDCDIIKENFILYTNILFTPKILYNPILNSNDKQIRELNFEISNNFCPEYPNSDMDESYELSVSEISRVKTATIWGALRALDTFSQLTFIKNNDQLAIYNSTVITDAPRFRYRGLHLDTARHFIPVPLLKRVLDGMFYNKLNVFHWHIVDDQSFPFELKKYPNLTFGGRYSPQHVYSQRQVKDIINHARIRGIRVIPEFDSPGHVAAIGRMFPKFITVCWNDGKPYQAIYSIQAEAEIFNPTIVDIYPFVTDILSEFKDVFVDEFIHLGNDEVYYDCWKSNPNITEWMKEKNFTKYSQLEAFYSNKLLEIATTLNKKVTVWQDVFDNGVRPIKSTVIQIWKDREIFGYEKSWQEYADIITKEGFQVILSSPWYINFVSYGFDEWYNYYKINLLNFTGGNLETRLWPRASAIAERLWSPEIVNDPEEDEHRCRLLRRGLIATPVLNGFCGNYEYGMDKSVIFDPFFNYDGWPGQYSSTPKSRSVYKRSVFYTLLLNILFFYA